MMDRSVFESKLREARRKMESGERPDYWKGYERGLRRRYRGKPLGEPDDHGKWLGYIFSPDHSKRELGRGYFEGYHEEGDE
jgi:hypothetical protein